MKILCVGDLHLRDSLGYAEYFPDKREGEKAEILDFIVKSSAECDAVVLLGDVFHQRNNSSKAVKDLVEFLERFEKHVYIIAGNHEKSSDGKSALDFLKEIKGKNWKIVTDRLYIEHGDENLVFCPFFFYSELGTSNKEEASAQVSRRICEWISPDINKKNYLFVHHAISDVEDYGGINTNQYNEVVLDRKDLEQFKTVFGGHIHFPSNKDNVFIAGSVFANKVGDEHKYVYILDTISNDVEELVLPGRHILKIDYAGIDDLLEIKEPALIKVHVKTDKDVAGLEAMKEKFLEKGQALMIIKENEKQRNSINVSSSNNILDMPLEALLDLYAERRGVSSSKLKDALRLIN